jgi:hypothetical protein
MVVPMGMEVTLNTVPGAAARGIATGSADEEAVKTGEIESDVAEEDVGTGEGERDLEGRPVNEFKNSRTCDGGEAMVFG